LPSQPCCKGIGARHCAANRHFAGGSQIAATDSVIRPIPKRYLVSIADRTMSWSGSAVHPTAVSPELRMNSQRRRIEQQAQTARQPTCPKGVKPWSLKSTFLKSQWSVSPSPARRSACRALPWAPGRSAVGVGRNQCGGIHRNDTRSGRTRHRTHRYRSGVWVRSLRGNYRPGACRGSPSLARTHRHQDRPRMEGRQSIPQCYARANDSGGRGFPAPAADRSHRHLPAALARSAGEHRGIRRRHA
jgi:hypothetical protein